MTKVLQVAEAEAVEAIVAYFRNDADLDDVARMYSELFFNGRRIAVVSVEGVSDTFQNGERKGD